MVAGAAVVAGPTLGDIDPLATVVVGALQWFEWEAQDTHPHPWCTGIGGILLVWSIATTTLAHRPDGGLRPA